MTEKENKEANISTTVSKDTYNRLLTRAGNNDRSLAAETRRAINFYLDKSK